MSALRAHHDKVATLTSHAALQATRNVICRTFGFVDFSVTRRAAFGRRPMYCGQGNPAAFPNHTTLGLGVVVTGVRRRTPRMDTIDGMKLRLSEFGDAEPFVGLSYFPCNLWR
jgi:hypothetical protein